MDERKEIINKIIKLKKNIEIVQKLAGFWNSSFFYKFLYKKIFKHRFDPYDVAYRYVDLHERKLDKLYDELTLYKRFKSL